MENKLNTKFDLVILATKKNFEILKIALPYYKKNIEYKNIWVVSKFENKEEIEKMKGVKFLMKTKYIVG